VVVFKSFLQVKIPGGQLYEFLPDGIRNFMLVYLLVNNMETLSSAIIILMRWEVLIALLVGSIGGVIIGAGPGVDAAVAIAILLPATFAMEPIVGLTLLLGIYRSSMYGGAIPAILINTSGTAVNALTTYDGHPIARDGNPKRALSLAYSASFFRAFFRFCA